VWCCVIWWIVTNVPKATGASSFGSEGGWNLMLRTGIRTLRVLRLRRHNLDTFLTACNLATGVRTQCARCAQADASVSKSSIFVLRFLSLYF
jgi:hypothetical protein